MESFLSNTKGSVVRVPTTEADTLSPLHRIMKIRRDLARALQGLPGAPLPAHCTPIVLRFRGSTPGPPVPLIFCYNTDPLAREGRGSGGVDNSKGPVEDQSQEVGSAEGKAINKAREEFGANAEDGKEGGTNY